MPKPSHVFAQPLHSSTDAGTPTTEPTVGHCAHWKTRFVGTWRQPVQRKAGYWTRPDESSSPRSGSTARSRDVAMRVATSTSEMPAPARAEGPTKTS
jgi:hypothetical protein